jgi:hypothetical protein
MWDLVPAVLGWFCSSCWIEIHTDLPIRCVHCFRPCGSAAQTPARSCQVLLGGVMSCVSFCNVPARPSVHLPTPELFVVGVTV